MNIIIDPEITRLYGYPLSTRLSAQNGFEGSALISIDEIDPGLINTTLSPGWEEDWDLFFDRIAAVNAILCDADITTTRKQLADWCEAHPEARVGHWNRYGNQNDYGLRFDTDEHTYVIRLYGTNPELVPIHGEIRSYKKAWLEQHMAKAKNGIRFITPQYDELFCAKDGDLISITTEHGGTSYCIVRYVDDYHMEAYSAHSNHLYHICEFGEIQQRNNAIVKIAGEAVHL